MAWCPVCVWNRIQEDGQAALTGLPSRLPAPMRNLLLSEELVEFKERLRHGAFWQASPRGRAVIRAGRGLIDEDDDGE